jgi:acetyl esterase/lipase
MARIGDAATRSNKGECIMASRHLVHRDLLPRLEQAPSFKFTKKNLGQIRAAANEMLREAMSAIPPLPDIAYSERMVPGPKGAPDVRVLLYQPRAPKSGRPAYLYIHGGGYVLGTADMGAPKCAFIAHELDCVVVSVDYRLAPETVFPGAVEDCYAALKWLHANAASMGVDPNRIAIGGESAGGGLAAALALLTRDRRKIKLIHQQLIYPMIDDRPETKRHPYTGEFVWNRANNVFGWTALLGRKPGGRNVSPYAAAARATNLKGLPPAFISTGALDLFLEEDLEYMRRLTRAGVPVEFHVYAGAYHGFDSSPDASVSKTHARDQMDALREAFARTAP